MKPSTMMPEWKHDIARKRGISQLIEPEIIEQLPLLHTAWLARNMSGSPGFILPCSGCSVDCLSIPLPEG